MAIAQTMAELINKIASEMGLETDKIKKESWNIKIKISAGILTHNVFK